MLISLRLAAVYCTSVRTGEAGYIAFTRGISSFTLARRTAIRQRNSKWAKCNSRPVLAGKAGAAVEVDRTGRLPKTTTSACTLRSLIITQNRRTTVQGGNR